MSAPSSPRASAPVRTPGSVRRTSHIDMDWQVDPSNPESGGELRLTGVVRDAATGPDGALCVLADAFIDAGLDESGSLSTLATSSQLVGAALLGVRVGVGFRGRAADEFPDERGRPLGMLFDDLPVAALIAGYARLKNAEICGIPPSRLSPMEIADAKSDLCAGWADSGTMIASIRAGRGVPVSIGPRVPEPAPDDRDGWHAEPLLPSGSMRRRRRIDVVRAPEQTGGFEVDAWFRDTWCGPRGREEGLHEYTVQARVDADLVIREIVAVPHVLPFGECLAAAAFPAKLVGSKLAALRRSVPRTLVSLESCTHLNDLLRSIEDVVGLSQSVGRRH